MRSGQLPLSSISPTSRTALAPGAAGVAFIRTVKSVSKFSLRAPKM